MMKNTIRFTISFTALLTFMLLVILLYSATVQAKKRCKPFLEKLHSIQSMQRQGHSLNRGKNLRVKEDKARDKWWQCEHSSLAKFKAQYGGKKKKNKKYESKKIVRKSSYYAKVNKVLSHPESSAASFNQSSAIVIKSKYEGDKLSAWLQFYQQPIKCQRPKNFECICLL